MTKANVNVFGTIYSFELIDVPDEYMFDNQCDGYTNYETRTIKVYCKREEAKRIAVHELIHAFLYECGLHVTACTEYFVEILTEIFERIYFIMSNQFEEVKGGEENEGNDI